MFLYTIAAPQQIFPADPNAAYCYKSFHTHIVEGNEQNGQFIVSRLISTDPALYLNPRFSPGGELKKL